MTVNENSYYDTHRVFMHGLTARDIAEPLVSFDATTSCEVVCAVMDEHSHDVAGVREEGVVTGYVERPDLGDGACGQYACSIDESIVFNDSAPLTEVVLALARVPRIYVRLLGVVGGLVTRSDLQDPPVRMWLFGMITILEMRFLKMIERRYAGGDEGWQHYLSASRLAKSEMLMAERIRRNQNPRLLDCLQFSDKAQIVVRDEELRKRAGFASRRRADATIKGVERLRNNLAHAQDIVSFDWETIVLLVENLDVVLDGPEGVPRAS